MRMLSFHHCTTLQSARVGQGIVMVRLVESQKRILWSQKWIISLNPLHANDRLVQHQKFRPENQYQSWLFIHLQCYLCGMTYSRLKTSYAHIHQSRHSMRSPSITQLLRLRIHADRSSRFKLRRSWKCNFIEHGRQMHAKSLRRRLYDDPSSFSLTQHMY